MKIDDSIAPEAVLDPVAAWLRSARIGIIGLGYVGLPLAVEFGKRFPVTGFDISERRIESLRKGVDHTLETSKEELQSASHLSYTTSSVDLEDCNVMIVAVPTPIDKLKRPDLTDLLSACRVAGSVLKRGDLVIFESTVYPGCTEEDCVPVLEAVSGLKLNEDFHVGYSPERVNPGDREHRLADGLMSPSRTLNSCGSSSILVRRMNAPTRVTRLSPTETDLLPSRSVASCRSERNLKIRKGRLP